MLDRRALIAALSLAPLAARAADPLDRLGEPRAHAMMRHALAPGTGDPPGLRLDDPATQRRLSDEGRAQARAAGAALRARGVRFAEIWSSRWDRCLETAALLGLGPVRPEPALDSFFGDRAQGPAQTEALRALLMARDPQAPVLMVTHQVNVTALTGVVPASGELVVLGLDAGGAARVLGRARPA